MYVDNHAFKDAFIRGETGGFVVTAGPPTSTVEPSPPHFAEIFGAPDCYHIFELREAAEFQRSLAATARPPVDYLAVREIRVENIRDYQRLAGQKTVFLVDRHRRIALSLRVGDLPVAARTQTPFPGPLPPGLRILSSPPAPTPLTATNASSPTTEPAPPSAAPPRRPPRLLPDPPESSSGDTTPPSSDFRARPGLLRRLFGWFDTR